MRIKFSSIQSVAELIRLAGFETVHEENFEVAGTEFFISVINSGRGLDVIYGLKSDQGQEVLGEAGYGFDNAKAADSALKILKQTITNSQPVLHDPESSVQDVLEYIDNYYSENLKQVPEVWSHINA